MIYILNCVLDDPRFRGFQGRDEPFNSVVKPRTTRELSIRRLAGNWTPPEVTGRVPPINHYPCINLSYPAFSAHAAHCLKDLLEPNGELLLLRTEAGEFCYFNLTTVTDVLDVERSSIEWLIEPISASVISRHEFKPERLGSLVIFRIPEDCRKVFVTQQFVDRALESSLTGLCFYPVWPVPRRPDWKGRGRRIMVTPSPKTAMKVKNAKSQSVRVTIKLTTAGGDKQERQRLERLEKEVMKVVERVKERGQCSFPIGFLEYSEYGWFLLHDVQLSRRCRADWPASGRAQGTTVAARRPRCSSGWELRQR